MIDIEEVLRQWFINLLIKRLLVVILKIKIFLIKNQQKNYTNQLLGNLRRKKVHSFFIDNISGADLADMQLNLTKNLGFCCVLLIFTVNMFGLFL